MPPKPEPRKVYNPFDDEQQTLVAGSDPTIYGTLLAPPPQRDQAPFIPGMRAVTVQERVLENAEELERRARAADQIAADVGLLREMAGDQLRLVQEQGDMLDRVGYNVASAQHNMSEAVRELEKANEYAKCCACTML